MPERNTKPLTKAARLVLITAGFLCIGLGLVGIFLPLVPTVPFLLLAAACFARSSERLHKWLLDHRYLGPMIWGYLHGSGIPRRAKVTAIAMIWLTMTPSALFLVSSAWITFLLFAVAAAVTTYLVRLPTLRSD